MPKRETLHGTCRPAADGHTRLTRGDGVCVIGGNQEEHAKGVEIVVKTHENLERQGSSLAEADPQRVVEAVCRAYEDVVG